MEKTVVELFAGVGGFRVGLNNIKQIDNNGLAIENGNFKFVWYNQWEPSTTQQYAFDCYNTRFGKSESHSNVDINLVDKAQIPDHTLLCAGFPCLAANSLVLTTNGYKYITDIRVNDYVISHDGLPHRVTNWFDQGKKEVFKLKSSCLDELILTKNHQLLVKQKKWKTTKINKRSVNNCYYSDPVWMSLDEIIEQKSKNSILLLGCPINTNSKVPEWTGVDIYRDGQIYEHKNDLDLNQEDIWYLVGRYLGDGWVKKNYKNKYHPYGGIVICCAKDEIDEFRSKISSKFHYSIAEERTVFKFHFSSLELATFISQFGVGAENKQLPGFVFDLPINLLKSLLDGYKDSDGCETHDHNRTLIQFSTISHKLAYGIAQCVQKVYKTPAYVYKSKANRINGKCIIEGRVVNESPLYQVKYNKDNPQRTFAFYEGGYVWHPIRKITKEMSQVNVYDIEVESSHSFVVNGCISHNCQDYSVAHSLSKEKGIEGKKGVLWWQIKEVIEAKKPPFILFENVDRLLKSPSKQRGRDFGIMLRCLSDLGYAAEWRVINAADYGFSQRRKRIFLVAYRNTTKYYKNSTSEMSDIICKDGIFAKAFPAFRTKYQEFGISNLYVYSNIIDLSNEYCFDFKDAGYMKNGLVFTTDICAHQIEPQTLKTIVEGNVDNHYFLTKEQIEKFKYLRGNKKIPRVDKNGFEYDYVEGAMTPYDYLNSPSRTMLTSEGTVNRCSHIIKDPVKKKLRFLTPIECERLNQFPDNWTDTGMPERKRYFMMGNALVCGIINKIGMELEKIIEGEE